MRQVHDELKGQIDLKMPGFMRLIGQNTTTRFQNLEKNFNLPTHAIPTNESHRLFGFADFTSAEQHPTEGFYSLREDRFHGHKPHKEQSRDLACHGVFLIQQGHNSL